MKNKRIKTKNNSSIISYNNTRLPILKKICTQLYREIQNILVEADSRIYYSMPVWFIDENPIVGYIAKSNYVNLLFWSGRLFHTEGLLAAGKYKAAQIKYRDIKEINSVLLRDWLKEATLKIWDYKLLRKS